ncbi:MAG: ABC transporter permease [Euryarchaeota archaeon]|nr:ABC transporter permease [Euryarchaeota archaeon]
MGLSPIEYHPWNGKRTEHGRRFVVIAESILRRSIGSRWFLAVLIIGTFLTFALPIIFTAISPHEGLVAEDMASQLNNGVFFIFLLILAALVCSDLIAEDKRSNSLVLYMSRALDSEGYLSGKFLGAAATLSIFAFVPPLILAVTTIVTQSGSDYLSSVEVLGSTLVAGIWMTLLFIPLGLLISSLTDKKTYAAVATFMIVFVLGIVAGLFAENDVNWMLLGPQLVMTLSIDAIYGVDLPDGMNAWLLLLACIAYTVIPMAVTYILLKRRE